jgi:hypothetical protein
MFDGGILINVLGQLKTDDDPPHSFSQTFVLKPVGESFYLQHDIFRLGIHSAWLTAVWGCVAPVLLPAKSLATGIMDTALLQMLFLLLVFLNKTQFGL